MPHLTLHNGLQLLRQKAYKSVHSQAIEAIKSDINDPVPYFLLGIIASDHKNHVKALELLTKAVELGPDVLEFHIYYARELSTLGRQNAAKLAADKASEFDIDDAYLLDTLGVVYSRSGFHDDAIPVFKKAVLRNSSNANFHFNLAASAQFIGAFDVAETAYLAAIDLDPKFFRAWSSLIALKKQSPEDNHMNTLTALFETEGLDSDAKLHLGHSIAKTLEDMGEHKESLSWLLRAKSEKRTEHPFDRTDTDKVFQVVKSSTEALTAPPSYAQNTIPIFIVGLPRTGTTLVDRILSSHSQVVSAGELNIFSERVKRISGTRSPYVLDGPTLEAVSDMDLAPIGQAYLETTQSLAKGAPYMIDKMPLNFFYAPSFIRAFPKVKIIALRRGPMDSCLSNFRQLFSTQFSYYNYTFDLGHTAYFYRMFDDLMQHFRATLPRESFTEIHYEDIVFDQENQTRRLLDFCGLDWEAACMRFHENASPVSTASSVQVRQPLYSGSIGRWKKYGDKLDCLRRDLGDLAEKDES